MELEIHGDFVQVIDRNTSKLVDVNRIEKQPVNSSSAIDSDFN